MAIFVILDFMDIMVNFSDFLAISYVFRANISTGLWDPLGCSDLSQIFFGSSPSGIEWDMIVAEIIMTTFVFLGHPTAPPHRTLVPPMEGGSFPPIPKSVWPAMMAAPLVKISLYLSMCASFYFVTLR